MSNIERLTVTMPPELAAIIQQAVATGDYASTSEVVREAVRDWKAKRTLQLEQLAALKNDIDKGLADVAAGRVSEFNPNEVIARGKKLLATRSA